jgi:hypothetical protein
MRSAQRLKTLLLMELLLGVARTLSQKIAVKENLRAETISVAMRLIAATLGSINLHEEFGFRFIFADTVIGADSKYIAAFKNLTPLLVRLLGSIVEDSTDSSNRLERAVLLTQLYEQTIDFDIEQVGGEITLVDPERGKKRMGQFYTPLALSRRTVSIAFNQLFADKKYDSIENSRSSHGRWGLYFKCTRISDSSLRKNRHRSIKAQPGRLLIRSRSRPSGL